GSLFHNQHGQRWLGREARDRRPQHLGQANAVLDRLVAQLAAIDWHQQMFVHAHLHACGPVWSMDRPHAHPMSIPRSRQAHMMTPSSEMTKTLIQIMKQELTQRRGNTHACT